MDDFGIRPGSSIRQFRSASRVIGVFFAPRHVEERGQPEEEGRGDREGYHRAQSQGLMKKGEQGTTHEA